jgi:dienelactone hydrolase
MASRRDRSVGSTNRWTGLLVGLALSLAACSGQNATGGATSAAPSPTAAIRWSETAAPPGVDVPGARWLKIEGAGGKSNNVQLAAVLRPEGTGPFQLVVWLHGSGPGFVSGEVSAAAHLAAGGFIVLAGCWTVSLAEPVDRDGVSVPRIPCLQNYATADDATRALVDVGQQLPGVKKGAIGLFGVSAGGPQALHYAATGSDIGAVVVDSSPRGPSKVNVPVLMLVGTADTVVSVDEQRTYEQALRDSGATVEAQYYEGGLHVVSIGDFREAAFKRSIDFYRRYLK